MRASSRMRRQQIRERSATHRSNLDWTRAEKMMDAWSTEQEQPASSKTRRGAASTGKTDGAVSMVSRRGGARPAAPPRGGEVQSLGISGRSSRTSRLTSDAGRRCLSSTTPACGRCARSWGWTVCFFERLGGRWMKYRPPLGLAQPLDRTCAAAIDARIPPRFVRQRDPFVFLHPPLSSTASHAAA